MRIGVDLGGTNVRAGLVKDGRIVRLLSEPCKADRPEGEVVDHIASLIGKLITPDVARIGIGVPSVVDAARGIVYNVVGIPSWREVYLKDLLENGSASRYMSITTAIALLWASAASARRAHTATWCAWRSARVSARGS